MAMPTSKDRSRSEWEKLREMNFKEKLEYIIAYYGLYILGIALVLGISISVLTTCLNRPDIGLMVDWGATYIEQDDFDALMSSLEEALFGSESPEVVQGIVNYLVEDDPEFLVSQYERLAAMVAAGTVDVFILSPAIMEVYARMGLIMPLEETLAHIEVISPDTYRRISIEAATASFDVSEENLDGTEMIAGIRITDSAMFSGMTYGPFGDVYFCICISTGNYTNALYALLEFFK